MGKRPKETDPFTSQEMQTKLTRSLDYPAEEGIFVPIATAVSCNGGRTTKTKSYENKYYIDKISTTFISANLKKIKTEAYLNNNICEIFFNTNLNSTVI